jgi:hypothetical protein
MVIQSPFIGILGSCHMTVLDCKMEVVGHQTICVPGMKHDAPKYCFALKKNSSLQYSQPIAELECAALFSRHDLSQHPFREGYLFQTLLVKLAGHVFKYAKLDEKEKETFKDLPYVFCVKLLKHLEERAREVLTLESVEDITEKLKAIAWTTKEGQK